MSYTYETYSEALALMMVVDPTDANFQSILPSIINSAELRMCRDIDFLSSTGVDTSKTATIGVRALNLPTQSPFVTLQSVIMITPVGPTNPEFPVRNPPLVPVSTSLLDAVYPNQVPLGLPRWFAVRDQNTILVGPYPDQAYQVELTGTVRPEPLSESNDTTFISEFLPDVFLAASMIFASGYQKNFGSQADNPQMAMSWDAQYSKLLAGAQMEEARKKFQSSGWTSFSPTPAATPAR